ncbi:RHS repeat-associated core domain-containing protein [Rapidithrix thailandica]|uniref:RHS repeat-associated core domain-containing protein n=1 Tax=Rapidithrix thailandica TaxID=413964 RepID=A0AAW9SDE1_9BACT
MMPRMKSRATGLRQQPGRVVQTPDPTGRTADSQPTPSRRADPGPPPVRTEQPPWGRRLVQRFSHDHRPGEIQRQQPGLRSVKCFRLFPTSRPPFGKQMAGRNYSDESYRYGFNGKEKDNSFNKDGDGFTHYDFGARIYDSRIGRWLSTDPLEKRYPTLSPYNFVGNMPIIAIGPDGEIIKFVIVDNKGNITGTVDLNNEQFKALLKVIDAYKAKSKVFEKLYNELDQSVDYTVNIAINTEAVESVSQGQGAAMARAPDENGGLIVYKTIDNYEEGFGKRAMAIGEELFHQFQFMTYNITLEEKKNGTEARKTPTIESEAKVFDMVLLNSLEIELIPTPVYMMDLVMPSADENSLFNLINFSEDKVINKDSQYWDNYIKYLDSFNSGTKGNAFYGGEQQEVEPKAYNKLVSDEK